MISLQDYLTSSGKYLKRAKDADEEVRRNATELLERVNSFLAEVGVDAVTVSSGFRPNYVNDKVAGAAKKSLHTLGKAIDLADMKHEIGNKIVTKIHPTVPIDQCLLHKYGLWLEDGTKTPTWIHLDVGIRKPRAVRIFLP